MEKQRDHRNDTGAHFSCAPLETGNQATNSSDRHHELMAGENYYSILTEHAQGTAQNQNNKTASGPKGANMKTNDTCTSDGGLSTNEILKRKRKKKKKSGSGSGSDSQYEDFRIELITSQFMETIEKLQEEKNQLAKEVTELRLLMQANVNTCMASSTVANDGQGHIHGTMNNGSSSNNGDDMEVVNEAAALNKDILSVKAAESFDTAKMIPKKTVVPQKEVWVKASENDKPTMGTNKGAIKKATIPVKLPERRMTDDDNRVAQASSGEPSAQMNTRGKGKSSPPVIRVYGGNPKEMIDGLTRHLGHSLFSIKLVNRNLVGLYLSKMEDHVKTKDFLTELGLNFFTFTPRELRPFSLMIRGLSSTYDIEDLRQFLEGCGLELDVLKIIKLERDRWIVQLGNGSDVAGFKRLQYILHCRVNVKRHRSGGLTQCRNCQRFGHISTNCKMVFRCVKCGGSHGPDNCSIPERDLNTMENVVTEPSTGRIVKTIGVPVHCVNCRTDGHVASSKECPKRLELLQKRTARRAPGRRTTIVAPPPPPIDGRGGSFADMARGVRMGSSADTARAAPSGGIDRALDHFDGECRRLLGGDLMTCIRKIGAYADTYRQLRNDDERTRALYGLLLSMRLDVRI